MKPLELTWYPINPKTDWHAQPGYIVNRKAVTPSHAIRMANAKRFTDAELAAAFWHARQVWTNGLYTNLHAMEVDGDARCYTFRQITRMTVEAQTLERFATLPHYDEEPK